MKARIFSFLTAFFLFNLFNSQAQNPVLIWRFANPIVLNNGTNDVLQFDVELSCTNSGTFHSSLQLYCDYNTLAFGTDVVSNGKISYTWLELMQGQFSGVGKYIVNNFGDNTDHTFAILTEASFLIASSTFMNEVPMFPIFSGYLQFTIEIQNAAQLAGIIFRPDLMDGGEYYINAIHPTETKYGTPPFYAGIYENDMLNQSLYPPDVALEEILVPNSGNNLGSQEDIIIRIKNNSSSALSNIPVKYRINGNTWFNEICPGPIAGQNTTDYTFSQKADLSTAGSIYYIEARTQLPYDSNPENDYQGKKIENIPSSYYCTPLYITGCSDGSGFKDFIVEQIQNSNSNCGELTNLGYSQYFSLGPAVLISGRTYNFSISTYKANTYASIWIDYNDDFVFEESEKILSCYLLANPNQLYTNAITIQGTNAGIHRMRARTRNNACPDDPCTSYYYGETEDYLVFIKNQLALKVNLEGPFSGLEMQSMLNSNGYIPTSQPYNTPPWNYNGTENVAAIPNNEIVDWVLVELRETSGGATTACPSTSIYTKAAFLKKDGSIVDIDGISNLSTGGSNLNNLFAVIWHRNHLGIMSSVPLMKTGGLYNYDYTYSSSQVHGGSLGHKQLVPGIWGMISGDGDANGNVNNGDKVDVWRPQSGSSGYKSGDFSLNGQVDNADKITYWTPNTGRSSQIPVMCSNTPPSALFTINPTSGPISTVFNFDASGCFDFEDPVSTLQIRWDWENDGTWDTPYSLTKTITHQYLQVGNYTVKLEVKDSGGLTDTEIHQMTVSLANIPPVALFSVTPTVGTVLTTFTFDATPSYDNADPPAALQVRWDWENDGIWDTPYSFSRITQHQYSHPGPFTIKLEVKDTGGLTGTYDQSILLMNTPPVASFTVTPTSGSANTVFDFDASSSYDNEDPPNLLQVRWDWENDGVWDTPYSFTKTATHQYTLGGGTYTIKLEVKDSGELLDTEIHNVFISYECPGVPTVNYGGQVYNTVQIGTQCWLKENLNIGTMINGTTNQTNNGIIEKYCFGNSASNCTTYGGLYQWDELMQYATTPGVQGICPSGWHIPVDGEWDILVDHLGGSTIAGNKMKSTTGWYGSGNGTNISGFTALPGGYRYNNGSFYNLTTYAYFWSSTQAASSSAWLRFLTYSSSSISRFSYEKNFGCSVRCLKDVPNQPPTPPSNPNPPDNSTNQPLNTQLSWTCTDPENDPLTYDVYFGTANPPPQVATGQIPNTYNPVTLTYSTTYYWKIVAHDDHSNASTGPVWSFTTVANQPPAQPSNPSPVNNSINQQLNTQLSWTCTDPENDPLTYDAYFGTVNPPPQVSAGQTGASYNPGTLNYSITYFWKVVAHDDHGNTTEGPVWSFTTMVQPVWQCGDPFVDPRDNQSYTTVQIGTQCWMAENLNIGTMIQGASNQTNNAIIEKYCYDNNTANCDVYGGLYQWNEMMQYVTTPGVKGICPDGWHLPTDAEWCVLEQYVDPTISCSVTGWRGVDGGGKLKEAGTTHWAAPNTGATNSSGFTGLPGGCRDYTAGSFFSLTYYGYFWCSSESGSYAWYRYLSCNIAQVSRTSYNKYNGFSVRCLLD